MQWGDRYLSDDGGPLALRHAGCGSRVSVRVTCEGGHDVPLDEVSIGVTPAARR